MQRLLSYKRKAKYNIKFIIICFIKIKIKAIIWRSKWVSIFVTKSVKISNIIFDGWDLTNSTKSGCNTGSTICCSSIDTQDCKPSIDSFNNSDYYSGG